ncbi:MBL fold metallo-hydrolase [Bacteroidota bacterium]
MRVIVTSIILSFFLLPFGIVNSQTEIDNLDDKIIQLSPILYAIKEFPSIMLVCIGNDGVLLSDAFHESKQELLKAALHKLGNDDVSIIINTHWHDDHTWGNITYGKDAVVIAHSKVKEYLSTDQELPEDKYPAFPAFALPDILCDDKMTIHFNGETIIYFPVTGGHTDSDVAVYFQNANVLHIGDLIFSKIFPYIDQTHGGSIDGLIKNLEMIINKFPEDVLIVPGHVDICTMNDLQNILKMVTDTRKVIKQEVISSKTLDEIIAAKALDKFKHWAGPPVSVNYWITALYNHITN